MKSLICMWVILLTIYAPAELTRVIVTYGLTAELIFEIVFVWAFYISGMILALGIYRAKKEFRR